jgi:transposase
MPERGQICGEQDAALTDIAPFAHDCGTLRGKRAIYGGRRMLRHVMFRAAHHNPVLKPFADRLGKAGKPHKVIIAEVVRKFLTSANALCKSHQSWAAQITRQIQMLEHIAFNRIHVFIGPGEAAFAKHNAFARSGEYN